MHDIEATCEQSSGQSLGARGRRRDGGAVAHRAKHGGAWGDGGSWIWLYMRGGNSGVLQGAKLGKEGIIMSKGYKLQRCIIEVFI